MINDTDIKFVYILVSSDKDTYAEQMWLSLYSLRMHNPDAYTLVVTDRQTQPYLLSRRNMLPLISETITADVPGEYTQRQKSRYLKTTLRDIVKGTFVFLDTDTVIAGTLDGLCRTDAGVAMVSDLHTPMENHPFGNDITWHVGYLFDKDMSDVRTYFNSGVILSKDTPEAHRFYNTWHKNWKYTALEKDCSTDQQSLMATDKELGYVIKELDGTYNCQILGSVEYLHEARIIHFFNNTWIKPTDYSPFFRNETYMHLKDTGAIDNVLDGYVRNVKSAFMSPTMIVGREMMMFILSQEFRQIYDACMDIGLRRRTAEFAKKLKAGLTQEKTVTIIIPTYNMEAYLAKCLSSLIIGSGQSRVEAIVVNDGSTDGSLSIAQKFAMMYPETFRIIDKENGNYGSCINAALKVATGKYVKILDADDSFDNNAFREFVDLLERTDTDLVLNDKVEIMHDGEFPQSLRYPAGRIDDFFGASTISNFRHIMMHNITYRRDLFGKFRYIQTEGIFYTDGEWAFAPMAYVDTAYHFDKPMYHYLLTREGQSVSSDVADRHIADEIKVAMKNTTNFIDIPADRPQRVMDILYQKRYHEIRRLYKRVLVKRTYLGDNVLRPIDNELRMRDQRMYKQLERETKYGLRYISAWRKNANSRMLKFIVWAYQRFKRKG